MEDTRENIEGEETSSLAAEFDSSAFMNDDLNNDSDEYQDDEDDNQNDDNQNENDNDNEDSYSDWDDDSENDDKDNSSNDSDNYDNSDSDNGDNDTDTVSDSWRAIAEEVGIDVEDYDSFIEALKGQKELASKGVENEKIKGLENLVQLDDETLMRKELKARGFSEDEIEDEIDILIENNTIRSQARAIRKDLEAVIQSERENATTAVNTNATQDVEAEEAARELREYMSKTNEIFGGKINPNQREKHADYITSGKFFDEISDSAETMAQAAWLWKYREQILNNYKNSGLEKGKAAILDRMVNPETTRKTRIPDPETGEFNPNRFMDSEQM